jgi:hypothetical protein
VQRVREEVHNSQHLPDVPEVRGKRRGAYRMIPPVRTWNVRILATETEPEERMQIETPTKALVRIIFRLDFPRYWGRAYKISLARD